MKKLRKKEVLFIGRHLKEVDLTTMELSVVQEVDSKELHVVCYPSRKELWIHLQRQGLKPLLTFFVDTFCETYTKCCTGSERFGRFIVAWYQKTGTLASRDLETEETKRLWLDSTSNFNSYSVLDRSALISGIASCAYAFLARQVSSLQSTWRSKQLNAVDLVSDPVADDDGSLYRLFGFSLHVSMKFRKRASYGGSRAHFTIKKRKQYLEEYLALKTLVETDRSVLLGIVRFQDRGKMTFPHRVLLPFMRKCSVCIKRHPNCREYKKVGRKMVSNARTVVQDKELLADFKAIVVFHCDSATETVIHAIFIDLVRRVIHTMANSLLQSQAMLDRLASKKGVDAEMALRDKLKAYASDKCTRNIFV